VLSDASERFGAPLVVAFVSWLAFAPDDASAAALRNSATSLGALAVFATMLLVREWPVALTGTLWAAGTVFAAALWLLRTRSRPDWFALSSGWRTRSAKASVLAKSPSTPSLAGRAIDVQSQAVLDAARVCFVDLQAAWDAGDVEALRVHTTAGMLAELLQELPLRGPGPNRTDVVTLDAALLGLERVGTRYLASVEFSGMIRESRERGAVPFKEVWMLTCEEGKIPAWRLARQQALL
jgi:hypothetical protein